jgi:DNA-binding NarL/FixJ family response regulator
MTTKIRVLIVDDQPLIRVGIQTLLNRKSDIEVIGVAGTGEEAIQQVAILDPDVVLMDIRMPDLDGVEATRRLVANQARAGIIILTTFQDDENVFNALAAGARGYLLKDTNHKELADAIRVVAAGQALLHPEITNQVIREFTRRNQAPQSAAAPSQQDFAATWRR